MAINRIKEQTRDFLKEYVYPCSRFSIITDENADDIVDFIQYKYVIPFVNDIEENKPIDKNLLKEAEAAIDDICDN